MSKALCLFALTVIGLLTVKINGESRIIGGENAVIGQFPHHVYILNIKTNVTKCGGSIIGDRFVLTAFFCGNDMRDLRIIAGEVDRGANAIQHQVDRVTIKNGIAVMRVEQPFKFTANVLAIRLPTADILRCADYV